MIHLGTLRCCCSQLIVFTPKRLLREPMCVSTLDEMTGDTCFKRLIPDDSVAAQNPAQVTFAPLCLALLSVHTAVYTDQQLLMSIDVSAVMLFAVGYIPLVYDGDCDKRLSRT